LARALEVGIDGGTWSNRRGYGRFLRQILPELARCRPQWRFTVFLDQPQPDLTEGPNVRFTAARTDRSVAESASAGGNRGAVDLLKMGQSVNRYKLDLLWFPTVYSYFPVTRRIPIVVGIHDTMADRFPQWAFSGKRNELLWNAKVRLALMQATRIMTVSEYSKRSIVEVFKVNPDHIGVVPEGAAEIFGPLDLPREPFLLAVGGLSPNKNLDLLIRILPELRRTHPGLTLTLVGDYTKDGFRNCHAELAALVREPGSVNFAGFVPDEELVRLYNRCAVFVMPSLEEGFGLPLAEAMACGCHCVVSSGHALEELGGGAVTTCNPNSAESWVAAIGQLLDKPAVHNEAALRRSAQYSWRAGAEALAKLLEGAMS